MCECVCVCVWRRGMCVCVGVCGGRRGPVCEERIIEVSHWGNIAVEEHVHIKHIGVCV